MRPRVREFSIASAASALASSAAVLSKNIKGDLAGFLKSVEGPDGWAVKTEYDEKSGIIRVFDRGPHCSCPLVREGLTAAAQCDCTLGWQRETYSAILGLPVDAAVEESILRGGKRCVFRMTVLA